MDSILKNEQVSELAKNIDSNTIKTLLGKINGIPEDIKNMNGEELLKLLQVKTQGPKKNPKKKRNPPKKNSRQPIIQKKNNK